jgi:hypothetical protein
LVARIQQIRPARPPSKPGRPPKVGLYRRVLMTLVLLRQNLSQTTAADWFGVSQPTVSRIYRATLPLLEQVTCIHRPPLPEVLRARVVLVDGLVPIGNRRTDRATHLANFSGKRHRAGPNVQILADLTGCLLAVSTPTRARPMTAPRSPPPGYDTLLADFPTLGDHPWRPWLPRHPVIRPQTAATRTRPPPPHQTRNRSIATLRSTVERAIAHRKNWKILATGYRGRLSELPNLIRIITTLEYYRLGW